MEEENAKVSDSTVWHYACRPKKELGIGKERFLDLVWAPGEARADFGEANFYVMGVRRLSNFVLTFPFSNVGLAQVFPGENAECVWQALKDIFEFIGGVPACIVFDNAAGVGRRVGDKVSRRTLRRPLQVRVLVLQPKCRAREGVRREQGGVHQAQPVRARAVLRHGQTLQQEPARPVHGAVREGSLGKGRGGACPVHRGQGGAYRPPPRVPSTWCVTRSARPTSSAACGWSRTTSTRWRRSWR